jgi:hypothetical protein
VRSVGDACGFAIGARKLRTVGTGAWIYHYGYVKPPKNMAAKMDYFCSLYDGRQIAPGAERIAEQYDWDLSTCEPFVGSHPAVMAERIANKDWLTPSVPLVARWRNPLYWQGLAHKNTRTFRRWATQAQALMRRSA